jgi:trehalose 6-phosphate synthase
MTGAREIPSPEMIPIMFHLRKNKKMLGSIQGSNQACPLGVIKNIFIPRQNSQVHHMNSGAGALTSSEIAQLRAPRHQANVINTDPKKPYVQIAKLAKEPNLTIMLDFDGTLSKFVDKPMDARPMPGIIDTAKALAALPGTTVAFVSGRDLDTLETLTGMKYDGAVQLIGSHGSEYIPGELGLSSVEQTHLAEMKEELPQIFNTSDYPNVIVELGKTMGVGVNTRKLSDEHRKNVTTVLRELAGKKWPGARIIEGNGVVELSFGKNKGDALQKLRNDGAMIFCGDDTTDEDAFKIMQDGDLSIKVLNVKEGQLDSRPTAAKTNVRGPEEMRTVLNNLLQQRRAHVASQSINHATNQPSKLVVASNRGYVPNAAGGLAAALDPMMRDNEGYWFSWSGNTGDVSLSTSEKTHGKSTLGQIDLTNEQVNHYYNGYANSVLWAAFHGETQKIDHQPAHFDAYKQVNQEFAAHLSSKLQPNDVVWIHDYHLLLLADCLHEQGCRQPMGFFNHIPMPSPDNFRKVPEHRELAKAMSSFDLIAMQTTDDVKNFVQYLQEEGVGKRLDDNFVEAFGKKIRVETIPIGIDVEAVRKLEPNPTEMAFLNKIREESAKNRKVMSTIARRDYSKDLPRNLRAFSQLLQQNPEMKGKVTMALVAAPSRDGVESYQKLTEHLDKLVKEINDLHVPGTKDWEPIIYNDKGVSPGTGNALLGMSDVVVVAPKIDGMNLVSKETVVAQEKAFQESGKVPGVLIVSQGAGASRQLKNAVIVESKNDEALVKGYKKALAMPALERSVNHYNNLKNVKTEDLKMWQEKNVEILQEMSSN